MDKLVFCRDCGFENADMTKFCRNCGSVFDASMGATPVSEEESSQILDTYSYSDQYEKKTYDKYTTVYEKKENSLKYLLHHPNYYDRTYVILSFLIPPFGIILSIILNDVDRSQTNRTYGQSEMGGSCSSAAVFGLITYGLILIVILNLTAS